MGYGRGVRIGLAWFAVAAFAAAAIARWEIARTTEKVRAESARMEGRIDALRNQTREVSGLRHLLAEVLARKQIVEALAGRSAPAAEVLAELSQLPNSVVLDSVRIDGLRLQVDGWANSERQLTAVRAQLARSQLFKSVGNPEARGAGGRNGVPFALVVELRPVRETGLVLSARP